MDIKEKKLIRKDINKAINILKKNLNATFYLCLDTKDATSYIKSQKPTAILHPRFYKHSCYVKRPNAYVWWKPLDYGKDYITPNKQRLAFLKHLSRQLTLEIKQYDT